jgi:transcription elongation factor Elf1
MRALSRLIAAFARPVQPLRAEAGGLVTCTTCGAEAVVPVDYADLGDAWRVALRCGNCGARHDLTLDDDEAGEYGSALDRGVDQIAHTVAELERRRLKAEVDSLRIALERDLIGADDFARRSYAS